MAIPVKLKVFEGPLDLLLHLIEKNKVDIYDIPIVEITEQYMDYIKRMEVQDMNVMSEFLVMAATLLDIKSRMLLPRGSDEEEEEEDPRAELVQRLLEHKLYRYMCGELRDMQADADKSFYRDKHLPEEMEGSRAPIDYGELLGDMTTEKLNEIFRSVMKRQNDRKDPVHSQYGKIEKDEVDMDAKTLSIEAFARKHRTFSFRSLLGKHRSRMDLIVTFLIVLEKMRTGEITVSQEKLFGEIVITSHFQEG